MANRFRILIHIRRYLQNMENSSSTCPNTLYSFSNDTLISHTGMIRKRPNVNRSRTGLVKHAIAVVWPPAVHLPSLLFQSRTAINFA